MLKQYLSIQEAAGLSITLDPAGFAGISLCQVEINGSKLEIKKKHSNIQGLQDLPGLVSNKLPLSVNIAGKGILIKQLERIEQVDSQSFSRVLPNAKLEDFYFQHFVSGSASFVSLIRKTDADKWLEQLVILGYSVLVISLGPFVVDHILPQLNVYDRDIIFDGHQVILTEKKEWESYRYSRSATAPFVLKVESEKIEEQQLLAYAAAFQLALSNRLPLIRAEVPQVEDALESAGLSRKVQVVSYSALFLLFMLLLVNFVLFSHLDSQNQQLSIKISRSAQSNFDIRKVNEQIQQRKALLDSLGWDGGRNKSVLLDQLAQLLPSDIILEKLFVNPRDMRVANTVKDMIRFVPGRIEAGGSSARITSINEWIARLKSLKWVKRARLSSYSYSNEKNTGVFVVTVDY